MTRYKEMYFKLFNAMTETIEILQRAQIEVEELYISQDIENGGAYSRAPPPDDE